MLHFTSLIELELDFSDHEELEFADRSELCLLADGLSLIHISCFIYTDEEGKLQTFLTKGMEKYMK